MADSLPDNDRSFHKQVQALIPKISEMNLFGSKLTFAQELQKAEATAQALPEVPQVSPAAQPTPEPKASGIADSLTDLANYTEIAIGAPEIAVLEAYKSVESFLESEREVFGSSEDGRRVSYLVLVRRIFDGVENKERSLELFSRLRQVRNRAVHAESGAITIGEAIAYKDICERFLSHARSAVNTQMMLRGHG